MDLEPHRRAAHERRRRRRRSRGGAPRGPHRDGGRNRDDRPRRHRPERRRGARCNRSRSSRRCADPDRGRGDGGTGAATAARGAGDLLSNASRQDNRLLKEVDRPDNWRGKTGDPLPDSMRPDTAGSNWKGRVAKGDGEVWQAPDKVAPGRRKPQNADTIRIMDPDDRYSHGYVRFYNSHGQPLRLDGHTGTARGPDTHIPIRADGTYDIPNGWAP